MAQRGFVARLPLFGAALVVLAILWSSVRSATQLGRAGELVAWAIVLAAAGTGLIATRSAVRVTASRPVARRFWNRLVLTTAASGAGALVDAVGSLGWQERRVAVPLYLVSVLALLYALLRLPVPGRSAANWLALGLDLGVVLTAFVLYAWFGIRHAGAGILANAGSPLVPVALLIFAGTGVTAIAKVMVAGSTTVHPRAMRALGVSLLTTALVSGVGAFMDYDSLIYIALPLSALGYVVAADIERRDEPVPASRPTRRAYSVVPYLAVGAVDALLVTSHLFDTHSTAVLAFGSIIVTLLVVIRQVAASGENVRLVGRLDATLSQVERQEHRLESLLRHSSDVITVIGPDGLVQYASPGVELLLGVKPDELVGAPLDVHTHPDDLPLVREEFERLVATPGAAVTFQARLAGPGGAWRWLEIVSTNLFHDPDVCGIVNNGRDITDNRRYQEELAYQAAHDELTGLANRTLFRTATDAALNADDPDRIAVALVDLDDFKTINDRLGHMVGDALLKAVSHRLVAGVRPGDTVARLGGDEFAVLLRDVEPAERIYHVRRILDELAVPVHAHGHELLVRASVGLTSGGPGLDAGELLRRADVAMYAVKGVGGGRCTEFDPAMDARAEEHARLAADLSLAVQRGEVHLCYQPIVALPDGRLTGLEALVRWTHPVRGVVSPAEFIPVAERTGLIVPLGAWVLHEACRQAAAWLAECGEQAPERMSVNVSARQLIEPDFPATVMAALRTSGLPAERLTMEITETAVFNGGPSLEAVQAVRALGVRVALDDFGTGHSSLGLLRTCPVDVLKVDKSFVDGVAVSLEQEAIVTSVSQIGTAMRLQVVAEGVETARQAERLHDLGYRFAQGFYFDRPLTADELAERLVAPVPA